MSHPTFLGMPPFPEAAKEALANTQQRANLARATTTIRDKRARAVAEMPDWEYLRLAGAIGKHLDLPPADAPHPQAQHLAHRLLRRPATRYPLGLTPAVAVLGRRQDPIAKTVGVAA